MNINPMRMTGLATGMDTDNMVKQMMKPYQMRYDKMKQDRQVVQWKQDLYRDILGDVNTFSSTYFDVLKKDTYMLSPNAFAGFDTTITSNDPNKVTGVSIEALAGATSGDYEVIVNNLAKGASFSSSNAVKDGSGKDISRATKLSELGIDASSAKIINIQYGAEGLDGGAIKNPKTYEVNIDPTMTVQNLIDTIAEKTQGNVRLSFTELTGKFNLETTKTGVNAQLKLNSDDIWNKIGFDPSTSLKGGTNAKINIKAPAMDAGIYIERETNTFVIDNVKYNLTKENAGITNSINIKPNSDKPFEKIKGFIDKYNEIIEKINNKISEKKQFTYQPLTDEQKKDMKDDAISKWEDKAKQGLLRNDSNLENILTDLRKSVYDTVKDAGISITDIGISTSSDTSQRGKLIIDEKKLRTALESNPEKVMNIFIKPSSTVSSYDPDLSQSDRSTRWNEEGIIQRFNDVLKDYTRTSRNKDGKKGLLIEKAGIKGDLSEVKNLLTSDLNDRDKAIKELERKLSERENRYYTQFAQLEKAMNQMNSQSNWLTQQLSGGNR